MLELVALLAFQPDVAALGSDNFRERQAASRRLERWAWLSWRLCDLNFKDPEVAWRARRVVKRARGAYGPAPVLAALDFTPRKQPWGWWPSWSCRPRLNWFDPDGKDRALTGADLPWWLARLLEWPQRPGNSREGETWPACAQRRASAELALSLERLGAGPLLPRLLLLAMALRERSWSPLPTDRQTFDRP